MSAKRVEKHRADIGELVTILTIHIFGPGATKFVYTFAPNISQTYFWTVQFNCKIDRKIIKKKKNEYRRYKGREGGLRIRHVVCDG